MQIIAAHPTGNRNVRAVITALHAAGMLSAFHTTLVANPRSPLLKVLPASFRNEWLRKTYPLPPKLIQSHPFLELARMLFSKAGLHQFIKNETGWASIDAVYHHLDRAVAALLDQSASAVYAYEDGALATFTKAKKIGIRCIYDLPIAYWETGRKLMIEEADRLPAWASTLGGGIKDSQAKLDRKTRELELADTIVCAGQFVKDSLPSWANVKPVIISPFGSPASTHLTPLHYAKGGNQKPLRVLFAGSMGQRKGLGDLFAAMRLLGNHPIELVVMGSLSAPMEFYRNEYPGFTYEAGRQHEKVLELMRSCDVFCLPSIVEGRALVMQEAMSQGLPVVITPNTGGADLVIEGKTGFLVPIRSPQIIAEKLSWFADNRAEIPAMGAMAQQHAATYTWQKYGDDIVNGLRNKTPWYTKRD